MANLDTTNICHVLLNFVEQNMVSTLDAQMPASREQQQQKKQLSPKFIFFAILVKFL